MVDLPLTGLRLLTCYIKLRESSVNHSGRRTLISRQHLTVLTAVHSGNYLPVLVFHPRFSVCSRDSIRIPPAAFESTVETQSGFQSWADAGCACPSTRSYGQGSTPSRPDHQLGQGHNPEPWRSRWGKPDAVHHSSREPGGSCRIVHVPRLPYPHLRLQRATNQAANKHSSWGNAHTGSEYMETQYYCGNHAAPLQGGPN